MSMCYKYKGFGWGCASLIEYRALLVLVGCELHWLCWSYRANPPLLNGKKTHHLCVCVRVCVFFFLGGCTAATKWSIQPPAVVERPSAHHFQHISGRLLTRQGCGQIEKPIGGQCKPMHPNSTSLEPSQVTSFEIDPQSSLVK